MRSSGSNPNIKKLNELIEAINRNDSKKVMLLLEDAELGASINSINNRVQTTTLIFAVQNHDIDDEKKIIKLLLNHPNIDLNATDRMGRTATFHAENSGNEKIKDLFIEYGAEIKDVEGFTSLGDSLDDDFVIIDPKDSDHDIPNLIKALKNRENPGAYLKVIDFINNGTAINNAMLEDTSFHNVSEVRTWLVSQLIEQKNVQLINKLLEKEPKQLYHFLSENNPSLVQKLNLIKTIFEKEKPAYQSSSLFNQQGSGKEEADDDQRESPKPKGK